MLLFNIKNEAIRFLSPDFYPSSFPENFMCIFSNTAENAILQIKETAGY